MMEDRGLTPFQIDELKKKIKNEEQMKLLEDEGALKNLSDRTRLANKTWAALKV